MPTDLTDAAITEQSSLQDDDLFYFVRDPDGSPSDAKVRKSNMPFTDPAVVAINAQTGTAYTLVLADAGKLVTLDNASAITLTVPPNSSVAFAVGTTIALAQTGAGTVTVAPGSGVTINSDSGATDLSAQYATASLVKTATDTWLLSGGLA